jgi:hypothetical protein
VTVLVWITESTWQAAVDAARAHTTDDTPVTLLHITGDDIAEAAHGAFAGLLRDGPRPGACAEVCAGSHFCL